MENNFSLAEVWDRICLPLLNSSPDNNHIHDDDLKLMTLSPSLLNSGFYHHCGMVLMVFWWKTWFRKQRILLDTPPTHWGCSSPPYLPLIFLIVDCCHILIYHDVIICLSLPLFPKSSVPSEHLGTKGSIFFLDADIHSGGGFQWSSTKVWKLWRKNTLRPCSLLLRDRCQPL